jgi:hypothetical protein
MVKKLFLKILKIKKIGKYITMMSVLQYYHQNHCLKSILKRNWVIFPLIKGSNLGNMDDFYKDSINGTLPKYSFIEPSYFTNGDLIANDQVNLFFKKKHPPVKISI